MSMSMKWSPIEPTYVAHKGSITPLREAMESVWGQFPIRLKKDDRTISILEGIKAAKVSGVQEIIDALWKHEVILVELEF